MRRIHISQTFSGQLFHMLFPTVRSSLTGDESPFCVKLPSALQPTRLCPRRSSFHSHIGLNEIKKNSKL